MRSLAFSIMFDKLSSKVRDEKSLEGKSCKKTPSLLGALTFTLGRAANGNQRTIRSALRGLRGNELLGRRSSANVVSTTRLGTYPSIVRTEWGYGRLRCRSTVITSCDSFSNFSCCGPASVKVCPLNAAHAAMKCCTNTSTPFASG